MTVSGMANTVLSVAILNGACTDTPAPPPTNNHSMHNALLTIPSIMATIGLE